MNTLYHLKNISKNYSNEEEPALNISELTIPKNKVIVILGNSGSGKTTLLNLLGMLDYPELSSSKNDATSNSIFDYYPDNTQNPVSLLNTTKKFERLRRQNFGFVFQESYLLNNLTNHINIQIPLFINGLSVQNNHLKELIEQFTLKNEMLSRRPSELSGGEAQRMAVIRSIVHSPKLILADEPTSNIPFQLGLDIFQFFAQWCHQDEERSLIWVTHNIEQAKVYGEHFIHLKDGVIEDQYDKQKSINNVSDNSMQELNQDPSWLSQIGQIYSKVFKSSDIQPDDYVKEIIKEKKVPDNNDIETKNESELTKPQDIQPPQSSILRFISLIKFVWLFAFSDIFPKSKVTNKLYLINYIFQRKNTQKLNMFTLIAVILFSLFFLKISYSLKNYFVYSISDPRINKVLVNRKKNTSFALKQEDLNKIASLVWVSDGSLTKKIVYEKELENHPEYKKIRKATMGAFGSRERSLDCYLSKNAQAEYSTTASLSEIIIDINDPVLSKDYLLEGDSLNNLVKTNISIKDVFFDKYGVFKENPEKNQCIITANALKNLLEFKTIPEYLSASMHETRTVKFKVLGVTESLPFDCDIMVTSACFEKYYRSKGASRDKVPGYEKISVYINDMLKDGIPVCETLTSLGFQMVGDIKYQLRWIKNLTDFVLSFSIIASIGILIIACGSIFSSYTQIVKQKQKEIAVLIAYGIKRSHLYTIFILELFIVLLCSMIFILPLYIIVSLFYRKYMCIIMNISPDLIRIFDMPDFIWPVVLLIVVGLAGASVLIAVRQIIKENPATILKTSK